GNGGKLEHFRLQEADAALIQKGIFDGPETDADGADEAKLDRLPSLVDAILQRPRLVDDGKLGLELDAFLRRLVELHRSDRLVVLMLPEEGHRVLEGHAKRLDNIPDTVNGRCRRDPTDDTLVLVHALHVEKRISAARHVHDVPSS